MISMEFAEISNRGDTSSSSDVMAASGEIGDGFGVATGADVLTQRLLMVPFLKTRDDTLFARYSRRHVEARLIIIELSLLSSIWIERRGVETSDLMTLGPSKPNSTPSRTSATLARPFAV